MDVHLGLLQHYQQLLTTSNTMLVLTQAGRWDELIAYEVDYLTSVEKLTMFQDASEIPPHIQAQIRPILKQILDNEIELKTLLHQRMEELKALVGQTSRQHNLNSTYGRLSGNVLFPSDL
ncbi:flagella biosynthesis regulatory protein FliT [Enterobacter cloacae]|uniref:Flagellar protein FliT n=1 Tax=Enterobacter cloacae TaxID=550 RepID=A0A2T4Y2T2_ENTCL|nr:MULTISPECIES: flagella biosynthesis regulatory protein FliT [Enterobacter]HDT2074729.1 flagella biosynthesis regulatory protein FliT [Enterobacter roggenkampii]HEG2001783.1 flagella biosynthesis regulatory protein FliT [Enterobacter asburiae]MBM1020971.1 flagella biosynthesis regulatory protein FliT [Enterobacter sp. E1]MCD2460446.1 flagella biosynthesis regulatory protein FliT [Enterobacter cloacae complex sp. 2021EL-01261]MDT9874058.1 flagella biosynthesis regulatory protein FliT [Enterob